MQCKPDFFDFWFGLLYDGLQTGTSLILFSLLSTALAFLIYVIIFALWRPLPTSVSFAPAITVLLPALLLLNVFVMQFVIEKWKQLSNVNNLLWLFSKAFLILKSTNFFVVEMECDDLRCKVGIMFRWGSFPRRLTGAKKGIKVICQGRTKLLNIGCTRSNRVNVYLLIILTDTRLQLFKVSTKEVTTHCQVLLDL